MFVSLYYWMNAFSDRRVNSNVRTATTQTYHITIIQLLVSRRTFAFLRQCFRGNCSDPAVLVRDEPLAGSSGDVGYQL